MILGSVFLATTGAEALYSDMGHVGRENIYFSWPFVKSCLLLNYMGQLYIGTVNNMLWIGCSLVVLYFRSGHKIESAYGLAITLTMLMTTVLIFAYLLKGKHKKILPWVVLLVFGMIESVFFVSSLGKFLHGGYFTAFLTFVILILMVIWYRGTQLENKFRTNLSMKEYIPVLKSLHEDETRPMAASNLIYLVKGNDMEHIDRDILYSIVDKDPKRAQAYWFVSTNTLDSPDTLEYQVETYGTDFIFRVNLNLGFKCSQKINVYLRQIIEDLQKSGDLPQQDKKYSIYEKSTVGNFKFCFIHKSVPSKTALLTALDETILNAKYTVRKWAGSKLTWYGLNTAPHIIETVPPVIVSQTDEPRIQRTTSAAE